MSSNWFHELLELVECESKYGRFESKQIGFQVSLCVDTTQFMHVVAGSVLLIHIYI